MKYMLLIWGNQEMFEQLPAEEQASWMGQYFAFTQQIAEAGQMVAGDPLQGPETATRVAVRDGRTVTTDGPYPEVKEVLGGYYVVDVPDLDTAIEVASRIPDARTGTVAVVPVMELPPEMMG